MDNLIDSLEAELSLDTLNLLYAKKYSNMDDFHYIMHLHPFMEIFYIVKGNGYFVFENKSEPIKKSDLIIVNSNVKHTEKVPESEDFQYIVLGIEGISIRPNLKSSYEQVDENLEEDELLKYNFFIQSFAQNHDDIDFIFNKLLEEQEHQGMYYNKISKNLLEMLIVKILRHSYKNLTISSNSKQNSQIERIKLFLDNHYSRDFNLDDLSNMVYLNKFYLIKEFKKLYGKSPINYLIEKRIEVSKDLLKNTDHMIKEIALIVGFNSQSYYSKLFFKQENLTPNQYRIKEKSKTKNL